jgi:hypothetical protein
MKKNKFVTMALFAAVALFAGSAFADGAKESTFAELKALKDGKGNRTGRSEVFRAGVICEQDYVSGVTLALASNIDNEAHAFEFAFLVNATELNSSGFQWGWLWGNYVNYGSFTGVQWGLVQNRVGGDMTGWQSAFGLNLVKGNMCGVQDALIYNSVEEGDMTGVQFAWVNNVDNNATGVQFGLINMVDEKMNGVQFGFANLAETANGIQCGFYNQADDLCGIQLGLVNRLKSSEKYPFTVFLRAVF